MTAVDAWLDAAQARADAATGEALASVLAAFQECVRWEKDGTEVAVPVADLRIAARALAASRTDLPAALAALRAVQYIAAKDIARQPDDWADDIALTMVLDLDSRAAAARQYLTAIATALGVSEP
ncbi:MAG: hypothetical protein IE923_04420 [Micrococcales bacterium]|nr:hypothetical protein [Micrococcales bacterium]